MSEVNNSYELRILKKVVNKYLDETISVSDQSLNSIENNYDEVVWDLATRIYSQSGHKVEFSIIRDVIDSRIKTIKYQHNGQTHHINNEEASEEAYRTSELGTKLLDEVASFQNISNEDESETTVFSRVQKIVCEQLEIEQNMVDLDSHLSEHFSDSDIYGDDLIEGLENEFEIEISIEELETYLGIEYHDCGTGFGFFYTPTHGDPMPYVMVNEKCTFENLLELISKKLLGRQ